MPGRGVKDAAGLLMLAGAAIATAAQPPRLALTGSGYTIGGQTARFAATTRVAAIVQVSAVLGKPLETGSHGDCGQGDVIGFAKFRGGFELSFVKGRLSGWTVDGPIPRTGRGIGVGTTVAQLRKAYPDVDFDPGDEANGGLGPQFGRDGGPNGWLQGVRSGDRVVGMFAGATCLAGV